MICTNMKVKRVSAVIDAPREFVFNSFVDFDTSARILHEAIRVDFKSEQSTGMGTEWVQEKKAAAEEPTIATHKIAAFNPSTSYVMTTDDESSFETMTFEFADQGSSTQVTFTLEITMKSFGARMAGFFLGGMITKFMEEDLNRMKLHTESDFRKSTS